MSSNEPSNPSYKGLMPSDANQAIGYQDEQLRTLINQAQIVAAYASFKGFSVSIDEILEQIATTIGVGGPKEQRKIELEDVERIYTNLGIQCEILDSPEEKWHLLPCLVEVLGDFEFVYRSDGETITVYSSEQDGSELEFLISDFQSKCSDRILVIDSSVFLQREIYKGIELTHHWFWGEFKKFKKVIFDVVAASFFANVLAVAAALFSLQVYDRVIPNNSEPTLWVLALGALLALILEFLLKISRAALMNSASTAMELSLQNHIMSRFLKSNALEVYQTPSQKFSKIRDFGSVKDFFTTATIGVAADMPFVFVFLLLVYLIGGSIVWILMFGGILMLLPGIFLSRDLNLLSAKSQGASGRAGTILHEIVYHFETIRTQRGEDRFIRIWKDINEISAENAARQRKLTSFLTSWSQFVQQSTYILAVVFGTYQVFSGEYSVGVIIAIGILTSRTLGPLTQISSLLIRWSNALNALKGLDAIVRENPVTKQPKAYHRLRAKDVGIEAQGVKFRYHEGSQDILDIGTLNITAGERIAILGSNGSGKSTLLKILAAVYEPTNGRVSINGTDVRQINPRDLSSSIGYLAQDVTLFSGTLRDNLNLDQREWGDQRLIAALEFAGLADAVKSNSLGLDMQISDGGGGFSVGQRQSIGWARLWLQEPRVLILDEPTSALDAALESDLIKRLRSWLASRTLIIATHRMPILSLTDRTIILSNGSIVVDRRSDAILADLRPSPSCT